MLTHSGEGLFIGTERFALEERIGEGGMGVVYRARDRERDAVVALKTLSRVSANRLLQFKREFRTLTDLSHPNVVSLYELISHGDHWFFTMELIEGVAFTTYAWCTQESLGRMKSGIQPLSSHSPTAATVDAPDLIATPLSWDVRPAADDLWTADTRPVSVLPMDREPCPVQSFKRLREALYQLARGVASIHGAGKLHCDIKPSNVLVTADGRVVVLDFGITADLGGEGHIRADKSRADRSVVGTPAYMSPEQAICGDLTTAADWYSTGVLLYETLTGRLPFQGETVALLVAKQRALPPRPSEIADGVPDDLDALCCDLLHPEAAKRPTGAQILRRLSPAATAPIRNVVGDQALTRPPFVGRRKERRSLLRALEQVERGRFSAVHVKGPSGIGKSSMVEHFLAEIGERRDVLILRGRCHERESVPFKAFDSLIDDLSRHLIKLPMRKAQALLPSGTRELAQIFPVLRAVSAIDASPSSAAHDPHERQRRGFSALRELLARIASRRLLVLSLDDLHWGDVDSARLLESIIAPPESPALLLVTTYRDDQEGKSPMLQAAPHLYDAARPDCGVLELGDLVDDEAVELAGRLLESFTHASKADLATTLARESQHHPLFLVELVRHAIESGDLPVSAGAPTAPSTASLSLDALLTKRVASLTPEAHRLIEVLVVAGVPIEQRVALVAAQIDPSDWKAIGALRARRLIHSRGSGDHFALEPAHQRIRRVVLETLDAQLARETSGRLARSLEATGHADPETLASMYGAAGETEIAVRFAIEAADAAAAALAFVRAAELYESARRMMPAGPPPSLTAKYAEALANAGRLYEAGNAFLEAADAVARRGTADAPLALELRRRAAEELLKSGREAEGLRVLRDVLAEVGLSYPETPLRALLSLSAHRAKTALRKLPRSAPKPRGDAKTLARADVAFTASVGLTMTDLIRGAAFGAQSLTLALEAGDPFRIGRALALEASAIAIAGRKAEAQSGRLVRAASDIEGGDPRSAALAALASSYLPFFMGDWRRAETELLSAQSMMRSRCTGVAFELINAECMLLTTLILSGQLAAAARRVPAVTKEATDRGDLYGLMQLTYARTVVELVGDRVDEARRVCGEHVPPWTPNRYTIVHWAAMTSAVSVERYAGRGAAAWTRFNREWKALQRSHLMRVQTIRVFAYFERAMCAIAAVTDGGSTELLDTAARDAEHILREDATYAAGMGHLILGCVAGSRGNEAASLSHLAGAVDGLERAEMGYLRACARVRRGELLGGGAGRQLVDDASRALAREGVESVERCVRLTAPMCRATSNGARLGGPR